MSCVMTFVHVLRVSFKNAFFKVSERSGTMTEIAVLDEGGNKIRMLDFGEYRSSSFGRSQEYVVDVHKKLPSFTFRDGDVLQVSYPKSGRSDFIFVHSSTLMRTLLKLLA